LINESSKANKNSFKIYDAYLFDIGHSISLALRQINNTYGEKTVSDNIIHLWYISFKNSKHSVKDLSRSG
jgi:hypothetical protein